MGQNAPWSSYDVLPLFALANSGLAWSAVVLQGHERLVSAIVLGLVLGHRNGAWRAVRLGIAVEPEEYSWVQMIGAGALAGIGFTMSLYIAHKAFPDESDFAAAKVGILIASLIAGGLGTALLWRAAASDLGKSNQTTSTSKGLWLKVTAVTSGAAQAAHLMKHIFTTLATLLALYALVVSIFVITENRRPQSTLAWMLVLFFAPGIGLLIYLFFGRDGKAFSFLLRIPERYSVLDHVCSLVMREKILERFELL